MRFQITDGKTKGTELGGSDFSPNLILFFLVNIVSIFYYPFQIFEISRTFKGFTSYYFIIFSIFIRRFQIL